MKVDFAFVCDYAEVAHKINALGIGFDTIYTPTTPCNHPLFFLVFQLRANTVEAGEKSLEVSLIDEDGKNIFPTLKGKVTVPKPLSGTESTVRIAMRFNNVQFPQYGSYSVHAVIEGHDILSVSFRVSPPPKTG